ncbi:glycosyltransferase family 92 protein [Ponticoccus alexandrii]|uniref:Glycosyltransferase family 92 protein n=2 Tax=Ponticoccus alexandrii TaxID=1943633 RepID=A0ABX7FGB6_9RHOB|nr:glycosyltransferase family 92 protein [Ponticoccus alexandrii]
MAERARDLARLAGTGVAEADATATDAQASSGPAQNGSAAHSETSQEATAVVTAGDEIPEAPTASGTYAKALLLQTPLAGGSSALVASPETANASEAESAASRRVSSSQATDAVPPPNATAAATDVAAPPRRGTPPTATDIDPLLSPEARRLMPPLAKQNFARLQGSRFAPHNRLCTVNEDDRAPPYTPAPPRALPEGSSGNVILACMKNEGPYILEWVAYHRAVGFDGFLVYTNGCEDGTAQILDRLQALGVLQHCDNDDWTGKSPQTHALDRALSEPVIREADWIAHIDVDEFVNIRCGNGTLADVFAAVPDATNIAMTWRLFGHNGVTAFEDRPVIAQFDTCAPSFCPKPHTAWGFKTLFRNIGAYGKLSCHRPNKLSDAFESRVKWVNGSGRDMTREAAKNGWRNSKKTIGYDMVQLNHYALRSADSFLVKRQRGRALHVDRSIGLNYWIRMDWSVHRDLTIQRNLPRLQEEMDRLLADPVLAEWHAKACDWHRAKAAELRAIPEFAELYDQALALKLTETERVAYALALDMET